MLYSYFLKPEHSKTHILRRDFIKLGLFSAAATLTPFSALAASNTKSDVFKNLAFYNTHTRERLAVCYCRYGKYDPKALAKINYILRDHRSNEIKEIEPRLLDLLHELSLKTRPNAPFHVISGYRSPSTNKMLRKNSGGVAKKSMHMLGKAIDIRIPGYNTKKLNLKAKQMKAGGVGYYPKSDFVHVDTGRVRYW
ncbi:MAG: DUF882 domain-containing protein [Desulfobacterales bacterium]|nr:DUF882 domain-containing protein [Desulfobacterales bacterium]